MTAKPVDGRRETERYARWTFDTFRTAAEDPTLSDNERIGFPDGFREGYGEIVWADMKARLPALNRSGSRVLDIGPGCGEPPRLLIANAEALGQSVVMIDHAEMLARLPDSPVLTKLAGRFPDCLSGAPIEGFDAIVMYSVLQTVFLEADPLAFVRAAMGLLKPAGALLAGDIPNASKLRRFMASPAGQEYHRAYMKTESGPDVPPFALSSDRIDDGVVISILTMAHGAGYDAYVLPQSPQLPMSNRREDVLIVRP